MTFEDLLKDLLREIGLGQVYFNWDLLLIGEILLRFSSISNKLFIEGRIFLSSIVSHYELSLAKIDFERFS